MQRVLCQGRTLAACLLVCLNCFLDLSGLAVAQEKRTHKEEPGSTSAAIAAEIVSLQSNHPSVSHQIDQDGYLIHVHYKRTLIGYAPRTITFECRENGKWSQPQLVCGKFVVPDSKIGQLVNQPQNRYQARVPKPGETYSFQFALDLDPEQSAMKFRQKMISIRENASKSGELPKQNPERKEELEARIEKRCRKAIAELKPQAPDRLAQFMGTANYYNDPDDPIEALEMLYEWWHFNDMFQQMKQQLDPRWSASKRLKYGREIMAILTGGSLDEESAIVSTEQRRRLLEDCSVQYSVEFRPQTKAGDGDQGWRYAMRVGFGSQGPRSARWAAQFDSSANLQSEWLRFSPDTNLETLRLELQPSSSPIQTMWVRGRGQESYLRVIPKDHGTETPFQIVLMEAANRGTEIQIPRRREQKVQFPY